MPPHTAPALTFTEDVRVELVRHSGDDAAIAAAARVSTLGELADAPADPARDTGLLNYLMRDRHGSPWEHASLTFLISAPIFVFREFHRHRAGWSYNEASGRYRELPPEFYIPAANRPLRQTGKPGAYTFQPGTESQHYETAARLRETAEAAYGNYRFLLDIGVAREVARMCLPLNIVSTMYTTCNPRSLMHFLSLRTKRANAAFPSYPQREIEMVAEKMEARLAEHFPATWTAFCQNGRVAP